MSNFKHYPQSQELCPKCGKMYCEGFWGNGVCTADMYFGSEPTAAGDQMASYLRTWYEINRETWWQRFTRHPECADEFILHLINEIGRIQEAYEIEKDKRNRG